MRCVYALGLLMLADCAHAFTSPRSRSAVTAASRSSAAASSAASRTVKTVKMYGIAPFVDNEFRTYAPMVFNERPYSMGGLAIGGGGYGTYDPYRPFSWTGMQDYYDPYSDITRTLPGTYRNGVGGLGYGASIEEVDSGDTYFGRPLFAYDEYNYYNEPWSLQARGGFGGGFGGW
mmetsp:Transcript_36729/g.84876  ORF Transcript_36729/g.84876 Transcript_36729/m.84876 type:complete len:175 (-) Transcript_36729:36-560(-)|eukprot:CAMPEP_0182573890 /NCGR_PEP_ID=MMETSP1324-20130603/20477_1 /TAXON_ID=236786 /ORGANISM="Florenciella sp., Strain RCC1587" /LENGTH=174 /DNA_ID=CAMNT_0024789057 /DNA_START=68 /DNA_END=592 /DNA_ORIENTATION=+